jgi:hypothetical protein
MLPVGKAILSSSTMLARPDLLTNRPSFRGERRNRIEAMPSRHPERMAAAEKSQTASGWLRIRDRNVVGVMPMVRSKALMKTGSEL